MLECAIAKGQEAAPSQAAMIRVKNSPVMFRKVQNPTAGHSLISLMLRRCVARNAVASLS